ncbi:hypothetical protein N9Z41_01115 [bacterium]|nr:hypothetical protein [bacterium]
MKLSQLKTIVKDAVKEAIQEEMKDILLEAVKSPKQTIYENRMGIPTTDVAAPIPSPTNPVATKTREEIRESYMNVLGGMMPGTNGTIAANTNSMPLQINGPVDTTSPNGKLPEGEVGMDQIMNLMNKR